MLTGQLKLSQVMDGCGFLDRFNNKYLNKDRRAYDHKFEGR